MSPEWLRLQSLGITPELLLRVPFLDRGRTPEGWDCAGAASWLTRTAFGIETGDFLDLYGVADCRDAKAMEAAIHSRLDLFEPCAPQFGAWLTFKRFGVESHIGWVVDGTTMIHADEAGMAIGRLGPVRAGGTFIERFDREPWKARRVECRMPRGCT